MIAVAFWFSLIFIFYAYAGYPLLLAVLSLFKRYPVCRGAITPPVSFIIAAYNEENRIAAKLDNTLKLDYPKDRFEVIVASDCSTDRTDEIVQAYQSKGVRLVRAPKGRGKENAQKYAVESASGEILIFSDVATILEPDGALRIVQNFNDPTVGCVSSTDRFIDPQGKVSGEGAYVRYEMFLRALESKVNTLVGLSGSFFAARRAVCRPWPIDAQSDFNVLLNTVKAGLRGVSDPKSIGYYHNIAQEKKEFERKIRTVLRGISVLMKNLSLLNLFKYGLFSWQLFSHKLCRWLVPFALVLAGVSNFLLLADSIFFQISFLMQALFYSAASAWALTSALPRLKIMKIPFYFVMVNVSILMAWYRYFKGERVLRWEPSQR